MTARSGDPPGADAALIQSIRAILVERGAPAVAIDDLVQDVLLKALAAKGMPPADPERTRYVHGIARNVARRWHRQRKVDGNIASFDEDADDAPSHAPYSPEDRELAARLAAEGAAADPQALEWLARTKVEGESEAAVARADGVPEERVRQRIARLRKRLVAVAAGALAIGVLVFLWLKRGRVIHEPGTIEPDTAQSGVPHAPTARDEALALRRQALHECDLGMWNECLRDLDRARDGDPGGDSSPAVRDARDRAIDALRKIEDSRDPRGPDHRPLDLKSPGGLHPQGPPHPAGSTPR